MALVKVKDFGDALKISGSTIRSKINRGQLLRNKNKLIDTENPINFIYLIEVNGGDQSVFESFDIKPIGRTNVRRKITPQTKKQINIIIDDNSEIILPKKEVKTENSKNKEVNDSKGSVNIAPTVVTKNKKAIPVIENQTKLSLEEKREIQASKKARETLLELELRQKIANAQYKEREAELKQIQLEKIAGNTLPLDLVDTILTINLQTIFKVFNSELENIATISVEILGGTRDDLVRITKSQNVILNKLVETARTNANFEIDRAVAEYSETRARGERR